MTGQILMPKLGLTMTEELVTGWHVEVGNKVQAGDILFSVETEKIVTDIEAPATGEIFKITLLCHATSRWRSPDPARRGVRRQTGTTARPNCGMNCLWHWPVIIEFTMG